MKRQQMAVVLLACMVVCGCDEESADTRLAIESQSDSQGEARVQIKRIGVFKDQLAYGQRRGIYVIEDSATGKTFIGVSGVGIAETGSHLTRTGKVTHSTPDER